MTTGWLRDLAQYVKWAGVTEDEFWTSPKVAAIYKAHLKALTQRVNVYTGLTYVDDPAIFSWGLYNEPRNPGNQTGPGAALAMSCSSLLQAALRLCRTELGIIQNGALQLHASVDTPPKTGGVDGGVFVSAPASRSEDRLGDVSF